MEEAVVRLFNTNSKIIRTGKGVLGQVETLKKDKEHSNKTKKDYVKIFLVECLSSQTQ